MTTAAQAAPGEVVRAAPRRAASGTNSSKDFWRFWPLLREWPTALFYAVALMVLGSLASALVILVAMPFGLADDARYLLPSGDVDFLLFHFAVGALIAGVSLAVHWLMGKARNGK